MKNSWMAAGCDATWRFPFCLEATSQAVVEVEGEEGRGGHCCTVYLPLSSSSLFQPPPPLSLCIRGSCLSLFDSSRLWETMMSCCGLAGLDTLTGCNPAAAAFTSASALTRLCHILNRPGNVGLECLPIQPQRSSWFFQDLSASP